MVVSRGLFWIRSYHLLSGNNVLTPCTNLVFGYCWFNLVPNSSNWELMLDMLDGEFALRWKTTRTAAISVGLVGMIIRVTTLTSTWRIVVSVDIAFRMLTRDCIVHPSDRSCLHYLWYELLMDDHTVHLRSEQLDTSRQFSHPSHGILYSYRPEIVEEIMHYEYHWLCEELVLLQRT